MSLDQTRDGLSRREALGLGLAGLLTSLRPKSAGARTGDEKRSTKLFFRESQHRSERGGGERHLRGRSRERFLAIRDRIEERDEFLTTEKH